MYVCTFIVCLVKINSSMIRSLIQNGDNSSETENFHCCSSATLCSTQRVQKCLCSAKKTTTVLQLPTLRLAQAAHINHLIKKSSSLKFCEGFNP